MTGQPGGAKAATQIAAGLSNFFGPGQARETRGEVTNDPSPEFPAPSKWASSGHDMGLPGHAGGNYGGQAMG